MLSVEPIFFSSNDQKEEAANCKRQFTNFDGDHITLLNVLSEYDLHKSESNWCNENFINSRSMRQVTVLIL